MHVCLYTSPGRFASILWRICAGFIAYRCLATNSSPANGTNALFLPVIAAATVLGVKNCVTEFFGFDTIVSNVFSWRKKRRLYPWSMATRSTFALKNRKLSNRWWNLLRMLGSHSVLRRSHSRRETSRFVVLQAEAFVKLLGQIACPPSRV